MLTAESIGDVSIGLAGRSVLNRFGRLGQSVETTLAVSQHKSTGFIVVFQSTFTSYFDAFEMPLHSERRRRFLWIHPNILRRMAVGSSVYSTWLG